MSKTEFNYKLKTNQEISFEIKIWQDNARKDKTRQEQDKNKTRVMLTLD